ncbi:hypothetical protein HUA74_24075 [Myxococcus sp. CA051A]|uniref:hypothetical protein n=1 Tax=Myxococcus sp. CA051A TaxID=2741739 RepID=UPI00157A8334|nr:hypothetical protein [Myxococcus sp. CA051A]NTX63739.1 hypothetical protein [Myxococcus sp. CA051A]
MAADPLTRRPAVGAPGVSLALGLLAALIPKCPLCIAAYLSLLGVTVGVAGVIGTHLRLVGFTVAALSLGFILVRRLRGAPPPPGVVGDGPPRPTQDPASGGDAAHAPPAC